MDQYVLPVRSFRGNVCLAAAGILWAAVDVPVQGNGHMTSPDRVPVQDNAPTDGVSFMHANRTVWHKESLLPVCRPEVK